MSGYARNLRKEYAGLVAGQAVLTAEIKAVDQWIPRTYGALTTRRLAEMPQLSASSLNAQLKYLENTGASESVVELASFSAPLLQVTLVRANHWQ